MYAIGRPVAGPARRKRLKTRDVDKMTMQKPGRNDPCYCGSGKKYKQCHLQADQQAEQERRAWAEAARYLRRDLLKFARDERFAEAFAQALPVYWNGLYDMETADEMSMPESFRFIDWFLFDYVPENGRRLIEVYHEERYAALSTYQQKVLDAWLNAPPGGGYELTGYEGQILHLRDILTGETFAVYEPAGHGNVEIGDVILARLVLVHDRLEFSTTAAYIPKSEVADLVEKLQAAKTADFAEHPDADHASFMRRYNHLLVHHALEQAEKNGRPPVARLNPNRADKAVRKAVRRMKSRLK
ncbi:MAG: hypothetical protein D6706_19205 [Chloroflexi bacterium]|nr:MAG: hypothetical protein D6706_19205 [Chloroflexota bacterium]